MKEGDTLQKRDRMRQFLKANGYRNGGVTIDASDWYVNSRLLERLEKEPSADTAPYRTCLQLIGKSFLLREWLTQLI